MVAPSLNEYRKLCNGLFAPRVCYSMQVMPLTTELLSKVRGIITKGALSVLKVPHRTDETITSALVHTGEGWLGFGVVDVLSIAVSTEVRMLTLGSATPNPNLTACHRQMIERVQSNPSCTAAARVA